MNLNGIGSMPGMLRPTHAEPRTRVDNGQSGQGVTAPAPAAPRPTREVPAAAEHAQTLPVEPPAGVVDHAQAHRALAGRRPAGRLGGGRTQNDRRLQVHQPGEPS